MKIQMFCLALIAVFGIVFCSITEASHKAKHRHRSRSTATASRGCPGGMCPSARATVKTRSMTTAPRATH